MGVCGRSSVAMKSAPGNVGAEHLLFSPISNVFCSAAAVSASFSRRAVFLRPSMLFKRAKSASRPRRPSQPLPTAQASNYGQRSSSQSCYHLDWGKRLILRLPGGAGSRIQLGGSIFGKPLSQGTEARWNCIAL